jgi:hypothetical protein
MSRISSAISGIESSATQEGPPLGLDQQRSPVGNGSRCTWVAFFVCKHHRHVFRCLNLCDPEVRLSADRASRDLKLPIPWAASSHYRRLPQPLNH